MELLQRLRRSRKRLGAGRRHLVPPLGLRCHAHRLADDRRPLVLLRILGCVDLIRIYRGRGRGSVCALPAPASSMGDVTA